MHSIHVFLCYAACPNLQTMYFLLQGIVLLLLSGRLLHAISFQPRFAILTYTLVYAARDFLHWLLVFTVAGTMFAGALTTSFGSSVSQLSTFPAALQSVFYYSVSLGIKRRGSAYAQDVTEALLPATDTRPDEGLHIQRFTGAVLSASLAFLFPWLLVLFVVVTLLLPYIRLKRMLRRRPHMISDLAALLPWGLDPWLPIQRVHEVTHFLYWAWPPTNGKVDGLLDQCGNPEDRESRTILHHWQEAREARQ